MSEFGACQVSIDQLHFCLSSLMELSRGSDLNQRLAKRHRERHGKTEIGNPDALKTAKSLNPFWQSGRYQDGKFGTCCALVGAQFREPAIRPVFGSFRLPQERAA